ncbi:MULTISPECIES: alpha-ketoglutarate-dependent dioxygenase AlkB family protein [Actinoalloteichus]|uniref:Alkylated DNA repair protein n=1 Tax=Actinoalloteichus fjordicus TaxID=1612552 RepID=A0AAC9LHM2_9PSEU|nr:MULTISPECIES: alpha-ketoglutarate-dependent dioxygenase AlkB [Actinoalloteichus]APU17742.1 alkylated DNA repair protein [Actinoalloteichus fjordicus]APU23820.1 alkylated DNA repair protein [Actinoalloteichus sp. GBA129-24]
MDTLFTPGRREIGDGAVHIPGWLDPAQQRRLLTACREWARGPVPMRAATLPSGHRMSVRTVCLGWHWQPYRYTRTAGDVNGARVARLPPWLIQLGKVAVATAFEDRAAGTSYQPDAVLVNFYDGHARMGMHRDADEQSADPVVSLSLGDACLFRFGNAETRGRPYVDVTLASGDLFVFGGPARFAYHGVPKVYPNTAAPELGLTNGRVNITMRVTGMSHDRQGRTSPTTRREDENR